MSPVVTLADLTQFTVLRLDDRGERTLVAGRVRRPGALHAGRTVSLHLSTDQGVWGDLAALDPDAGTGVLSVFPQNLRPAVVPGATFTAYDSEYRDRVRYALDPAIRWTRTRFAPPDAFVEPAPTPGWSRSRVARPGDEGRADGRVVPSGCDHEHCAFCWWHIEPGGADAEGYVSDRGDWVCVPCHGRYIERRDLRFMWDGDRREEDASDATFQSMMRMVDEYDLRRLRRHSDEGGEIDARSRYGLTPLMVAASRGHRSLVALLVGAGADVNAVADRHGYTALALAAQQGRADVAGMLLDAGAGVRVPDGFWGGSLLQYVRSGPGGDDGRLLARLTRAGAV